MRPTWLAESRLAERRVRGRPDGVRGGMTFTLSRLMSSATASYGVYALSEPRHLGRALTSSGKEQESFDTLAYTFGARDLAVSAFGIFGRSEKTVTTAMLLRILLDVSDGLILAARVEDDETKQKVIGVTFAWAGLNALALTIDRRRARRRRVAIAVV